MNIWSGIKSIWKKVANLFTNSKEIKQIGGLFGDNESINDKIYTQMEVWQQLYEGYCPDIHDVKRFTIANPNGEGRIRSLRMPKIACEYIARMMFSDNLDFNVSEIKGTSANDKKTDNKLDQQFHDIIDRSHFFTSMKEYYEKSTFAIGGLVVKPIIENGEITYDFVSADDFLPTQWYGKDIIGGVFLSRSYKGEHHYTKIEKHSFEDETYVIENLLYKSKKSAELGKQVDLSEMYPDLEPKTEIKGVDEPLFTYFKPAIANNIAKGSPLGISLFANSQDTLQSLDEAYDSIAREIRIMKARLVVPDTMLKGSMRLGNDSKKGLADYFDINDEVFQAVNYGDNQTAKPEFYAQAMRVTDIIDAINLHLNVFCNQIGVNTGTFTYKTIAEGVKTATEVISAKSETAVTKKMHEKEFRKSFEHLVKATMKFGEITKKMTYKEVEVELYFDDAIIQDDEKKRQEGRELYKDGLISKRTFMIDYMKYSEQDMLEEIGLIEAEQSAMYQRAVQSIEEEPDGT